MKPRLRRRLNAGLELLEVRDLLAGDLPYIEWNELVNVENSSSLITADLNGDGRLDMVLAEREERELSVSLARADGTFGTPQRFPAVRDIISIAAADIDQDGLADLMVASMREEAPSRLSWVRNLGNSAESWLGVSDPVQISTHSGDLQFVLADFDADGKVDLAAGDLVSLSVRRGLGAGDFEDPISYLTEDGPRGIAAFDLDADGDLDLPVINTKTGEVTILIGSGDGSFEAHDQTYSITRTPGGIGRGNAPRAVVTAGDLDLDGDLDLIVGESYSDGENLAIFVGNGDGTFAPDPIRSEIPGGPQALVAGDVDHDGDLDLAIAHGGTLHHPEFGNMGPGLVLLTGNGTPYFPRFMKLPIQNDRGIVHLADLDGDGTAQLLTTIGQSYSEVPQSVVEMTFGSDPGWQADPQTLSAGYSPNRAAAGDLDHDGQTDLVVVNSQSHDLSVLLGLGEGRFEQEKKYAVGESPGQQIAADFNGDGDVDLLTVNPGSNDVSVLLNNNQGGFHAQSRYPVGNYPISAVTADLNLDGVLDLAVANSNSHNVSILLGEGDGTFGSSFEYVTEEGLTSIAVTDINLDLRPDLVVGTQNSISVLHGRGDGGFDPTRRRIAGIQANWIQAADLNGDGFDDLVTAISFETFVTVALRTAGGESFERPTRYSTSNISGFALADLNADGSLDLVAVLAQGITSVRLGKGDGTFGAVAGYSSISGLNGLSIGDLNSDGLLDVAVSSDSGFGIHLGLGNGQLGKGVAYRAGNEVASIATADVDGDGDLDVTFASRRDNSVGVSTAQGDGTFSVSGRYSVGQHPQDVTLADLDRDGNLDAVVANAGSNHISVLRGNGDGSFQPEVRTPSGSGSMFTLGDFNGDTVADLVTSNSSDGSSRISVLIGMDDGTFNRLPEFRLADAIGSLFNTDINGDGQLDLITVSSYPGVVTTFLGRGDGTFSQLARTHLSNMDGLSAITAGDFDHDGDLDLAVSSNYPIPQIAVLIAQADGTFDKRGTYPVVMSYGNMTVADINQDGHPDLLSTTATYGGCFPSCDDSGFVVLTGRGDGTFGQPRIYSVPGASSEFIAVADLDNDQDEDLMLVNWRGVQIIRNQVKQPSDRIPGDVNRDGRFDSKDMIAVFLVGEYEDQIPNNSTFDEGDWNGDGDFDSRDFTFVFLIGHYEQDNPDLLAAIAAVDTWLTQDEHRPRRRAFVP